MTAAQTLAIPSVDLAALNENDLVEFTKALIAHPYWHIQQGKGKEAKALGIYVVTENSGVEYPPLTALSEFLGKNPFVFLKDSKGNDLATLDTNSNLLWFTPTSTDADADADADAGSGSVFGSVFGFGNVMRGEYGLKGLSGQEISLGEAKKKVAEANWAGLGGWRLPSKDELERFAMSNGNPYSSGEQFRLLGQYLWLSKTGACDVDAINSSIFGMRETGDSAVGHLFACNGLWANDGNAASETMFSDLIHYGWQLASPTGKQWKGQKQDEATPEDFYKKLFKAGKHLVSFDLGKKTASSGKRLSPKSWHDDLTNLDYTACRLPRLEPAQWQDPYKGLWELWGNPPDLLRNLGMVSRDPMKDVRKFNVAIDFGTSSTVVALKDEHGNRSLLRIGVRDFYETPHAAHYENPTVLEIIDHARLHAAWSEKAYRPALNWDWVHAAHEAQASFRDNPGDTSVLASILPRMKQWALRSEQQTLRLTDRQQCEITLPALSERNPVRGEPMTISDADPFDPIELYAWFLGMTINWRGRGLFLKYYLTFPVKYPRVAKDKILASFRRGLQRSLPPALVAQPGPLNGFDVREIASEPAAYAAAALPHLSIKPTEVGIPYAVFDFGGGTADFDFGLWRWATADEEEQGYEQVYEHLHSSGDNFLGGENLLEHLVYASFQQNLDVCRKQRIHFTRPLDGERFVGDEAFVHPTQAAQTNTVLMAAKLRAFLESESNSGLPTQIVIELLGPDGYKCSCEFSLDAEALDLILLKRIERGVHAFIGELAHICDQLPSGVPIQVLLAGNGSRSRHIRTLFNKESEEWTRMVHDLLGEEAPDLIIHLPLPMDEDNLYAPTAKTGVALGLLCLCPGEGVKLINNVRTNSDTDSPDEAPFRFFVGKLRRGEFESKLNQGATYHCWHELGPLQQGVFNLYYSHSVRARNGLKVGDPELHALRLDFPAAAPNARLFVRATNPNQIELVAAIKEENLETDSDLPRQSLDLE